MARASTPTSRGDKSRPDSKTGLHNPEHLAEVLGEALASAKRGGAGLSVVMVDLDQLSAVNDRHGQPAGDELIRAAAEVVSEVATAHQGIAARFGGDELCLLLPAESLEPAGQIAEEVRARIDRIELPLDGSGQPLGITASVGVASYPEHAPTVDGLLAAADVAVYDAKLEGRNRTWMASPPGVREALKLESAGLASQNGPPAVPRDVADPELNGKSLEADPERPVDQPATSAARSRLVAACVGTVCAGAVLVGALWSDAAIPSFLWLTVPLVGGLPLLTLRVAEKQYVDRSRATVTELRMSNDELEAANARLFGLLDENRQLLGRMQRSYLSTITSLARAVEAKDRYTSGHTERVAEVALLLARELDLDESQLAAIKVGAIIHDIGKVGTPDQILSKPGALTEEEIREIRKHPEVASQIVADLELPKAVKQMVRSHRERFDGGGYPDGLIGEQIPLAARILSVAEALDAMTSDRPYRDAMPLDVACTEIQDNAGAQFCPRVVAALTSSLARSRGFWVEFSGSPQSQASVH
jgi:diguanylate cyclase (GGDEF)-like protein/putative nucleotidyltransferase with HDIG domain